MDDYKLATAVHLHDQRAIISNSIGDAGIDSFWSLQDAPEYPFSHALSDFLSRSTSAHIKTDDYSSMGIHRTYADAISSLWLEKLEVSIRSERMIDIRMVLAPEKDSADEERWTETWTYSGSFTVIWQIGDN